MARGIRRTTVYCDVASANPLEHHLEGHDGILWEMNDLFDTLLELAVESSVEECGIMAEKILGNGEDYLVGADNKSGIWAPKNFNLLLTVRQLLLVYWFTEDLLAELIRCETMVWLWVIWTERLRSTTN